MTALLRKPIVFAVLLLSGTALAQQQQEPPPPEAPGADQPPPPPPPPPKKKGAPATVVYDGGATIRTDDGKFELKINGPLQTRWEWQDTEGLNGAPSVQNSRFLITRAHIAMAGYVFGKDTSYKMEYAVSDAGNPRLRDFWANQAFADGMVQLRFGQMKRPFNRNEITSDYAIEFVEKPITNSNWPGVTQMNGSRDIGFMISNGIERSPDGLEYALGIFNGQGDGTTIAVACPAPPAMGGFTCTSTGAFTNTPTDWQPQFVARLGFNMGGIKGYSEQDLEGGPLRLAVAASYKFANIQDKAGAPAVQGFEGDFILKIEGFDLSGLFMVSKINNVDDAVTGFHVQAGYMVTKEIGLAARYARVPLNAPLNLTQQFYLQEVRGALSYYWFGSHAYKWYADFGWQKDDTATAVATLLGRVGVQLIF